MVDFCVAEFGDYLWSFGIYFVGVVWRRGIGETFDAGRFDNQHQYHQTVGGASHSIWSSSNGYNEMMSTGWNTHDALWKRESSAWILPWWQWSSVGLNSPLMEGCYMNRIPTKWYYKMMFDCCFSVSSWACDSLDNGNCTVIGNKGGSIIDLHF
jgi:hypothetical protein